MAAVDIMQVFRAMIAQAAQQAAALQAAEQGSMPLGNDGAIPPAMPEQQYAEQDAQSAASYQDAGQQVAQGAQSAQEGSWAAANAGIAMDTAMANAEAQNQGGGGYGGGGYGGYGYGGYGGGFDGFEPMSDTQFFERLNYYFPRDQLDMDTFLSQTPETQSHVAEFVNNADQVPLTEAIAGHDEWYGDEMAHHGRARQRILDELAEYGWEANPLTNSETGEALGGTSFDRMDPESDLGYDQDSEEMDAVRTLMDRYNRRIGFIQRTQRLNGQGNRVIRDIYPTSRRRMDTAAGLSDLLMSRPHPYGSPAQPDDTWAGVAAAVERQRRSQFQQRLAGR